MLEGGVSNPRIPARKPSLALQGGARRGSNGGSGARRGPNKPPQARKKGGSSRVWTHFCVPKWIARGGGARNSKVLY